MIKKVISIARVGKFNDCKPKGDIAFRKIALIYSENGLGKSTLSTVFRSLQSGDSQCLAGRKTLGGTGEPQIEIRLENETATFKGMKWDTTFNHIEIFDSHFVRENVHSGGEVDHENKKNLYRFALGEQGVKLAKNIDGYDEQIRALNADLKAKGDFLKQYLSQGATTIQQFLELKAIDDIANVIQSKTQEVDILRQEKEIASRPSLSKLAVPKVPIDEVQGILEQRLDGISAQVEERIRTQITKNLDEKGEQWIGQGVSYLKSEQCPFCSTPVDKNDLIQAYKMYFGEAYIGFKAKIETLKGNILGLLSEQLLGNFQRTVASNVVQAEFWKRYITPQFPTVDTAAVERTWINLRMSAVAALSQKAAAPLERFEIAQDMKQAILAFDELGAMVDAHNALAGECNSAISKKKEDTRTGNLTHAESQLANLRLIQRRYEDRIDQTCKDYRQLEAKKKLLEEDKLKTRKELDALSSDLLQKYETAINDCLLKFGVDFKITQTTSSYVGGRPSSSYKISINNIPVDLGDGETAESVPSFRNTLSDGDKNSLAFAFFVARLLEDKVLSEKVVICDDPISSLDKQRKKSTAQTLIQIAGRAKQLIVLSHDPYFLREVWDDCSRDSTKAVKIVRDGQGSTLTEWDIEADTQAEYFQNFNKVELYVEKGIGSPLDVARCIRPLLETYFRMKFPREFTHTQWLADFIESIRNAQAGTKLAALQGQYTEINEINNYSKKFHHANSHREVIVDAELKAYAVRTMKIIMGA